LIAVPVVNVYGFNAHSRYLPDRRDLNRSFPGSERGSLAARLANLFLEEIVAHSDVGIDIHTAAIHRTNLPQIRISADDEKLSDLSQAFGAPVVIEHSGPDGTLRSAAAKKGIPVMLYEAGEALRFNEWAITAGVRGVTNVLRALEMLPAKKESRKYSPLIANRSSWVRAEVSGIFRVRSMLGEYVREGQVLGTIAQPLEDQEDEVIATMDGVVIGRTNLPLVHEGDALIHVCAGKPNEGAKREMKRFHDEYTNQVNLADEPDTGQEERLG
jgi:predicted deacylase